MNFSDQPVSIVAVGSGASGSAKYVTDYDPAGGPHWVTRIDHGPYVAYHYIREAADQLADMLNERMGLRETCEQHRAYAHMMQEQRSQIADYCRTLEKQIEVLSPNTKFRDTEDRADPQRGQQPCSL